MKKDSTYYVYPSHFGILILSLYKYLRSNKVTLSKSDLLFSGSIISQYILLIFKDNQINKIRPSGEGNSQRVE